MSHQTLSDGGEHDTIPTALAYARTAVRDGASIIDIGGYSTRPHAAFVTECEERKRVVPILKALREDGSGVGQTLISIDTFKEQVARAAIDAGANCINDVYAFTGLHSYPSTQEAWDHLEAMKALARATGVVVILMHSRGEATANTNYGLASPIDAIRAELGEKVNRVVKGKGGVRRWLVFVDPGIGFSKNLEGNLTLLRHASELTRECRENPLSGFPQLVGASRKRFLGSILSEKDPESGYTGRETQPKERIFATAAVMACAVQQGIQAIRVHDVREMGDVVRVAKRLWAWG